MFGYSGETEHSQWNPANQDKSHYAGDDITVSMGAKTVSITMRTSGGKELAVNNIPNPVELFLPREDPTAGLSFVHAELPDSYTEPITGEVFKQKLFIHRFAFKSNSNALHIYLKAVGENEADIGQPGLNCIQFLVVVRYHAHMCLQLIRKIN